MKRIIGLAAVFSFIAAGSVLLLVAMAAVGG